MAEEMSTRRRGICAVCDKEAVYAGQLTEYFSAKGGLPFEVQAFSSTEPLEAYAREHPIDLLLISQDLLSEKLKQLKVKKIMLLSDGSQPKGENLPSTYKYQSSEGILREVLDCYGTVMEPERTSPVRMQRAQFLGVYSPVRRCGRTSFALMLGQVLAADSRVLYLNFEEYSGFRGPFWRAGSGFLGIVASSSAGASRGIWKAAGAGTASGADGLYSAGHLPYGSQSDGMGTLGTAAGKHPGGRWL